MDASVFVGHNKSWKRSFEASRQSEAIGQPKNLVVQAALLNESVLEKSSVKVIKGLPGIVFNATRSLKRVDYYLTVTCASLLRVRRKESKGEPSRGEAKMEQAAAEQSFPSSEGLSERTAGQEPGEEELELSDTATASVNSFDISVSAILTQSKTCASCRPVENAELKDSAGDSKANVYATLSAPGVPRSPRSPRSPGAQGVAGAQGAPGAPLWPTDLPASPGSLGSPGSPGSPNSTGLPQSPKSFGQPESELIYATMMETEATTARLSSYMGYPSIDCFIYRQLAFYRPYEAYALTTYHMAQLLGVLAPVLRIVGMTYRLPRSGVEFPGFYDEKQIEPVGKLVESLCLLLHNPMIGFFLSQSEKPYRYALLEGFCTYYYSSCMEVDDDVFTLSSLHLLSLTAILVQIYDFRQDFRKARRSVATKTVGGHTFQISVFAPSSNRMFHQIPAKALSDLVSAVEEAICVQLQRHNVSLELTYHFYKGSVWYCKYSATTLLRLQARELGKAQRAFVADWGSLFGVHPCLAATGLSRSGEVPQQAISIQKGRQVPKSLKPFDFKTVTANLPEMLSTTYGRRLDALDDSTHIFLRLMPWSLSFREILFPSARILLKRHRDICAIAVLLTEMYSPHISLFRRGLRDLSMFPAPLKNVSVIYQYIVGMLRQILSQLREFSKISRTDLLELMEDSFEHHLDDAEVDRVERELLGQYESEGQTEGSRRAGGWLYRLSSEEQDKHIALFLQSFYDSMGLFLTSVARNLPDLAGIGFQPLDGEFQVASVAEVLLRTLHIHTYSLQKGRASFSALQLATHYATCQSLQTHINSVLVPGISYLDLQSLMEFSSIVSKRAPALIGEFFGVLLDRATTVLQTVNSKTQNEDSQDVKLIPTTAGRRHGGRAAGGQIPPLRPRVLSLGSYGRGTDFQGPAGREMGQTSLEEITLEVTLHFFLGILYKPSSTPQLRRFLSILSKRSPGVCIVKLGGQDYIIYSIRSSVISIRGLSVSRAQAQDRELQVPAMSIAAGDGDQDQGGSGHKDRKLRRLPSASSPNASFILPVQVGQRLLLFVYCASVSQILVFTSLGYPTMECIGHQPVPLLFPRTIDPSKKPYVCCKFYSGDKKGTAIFEFYYSSSPSGMWSGLRSELPSGFPRYDISVKGRNRCKASVIDVVETESRLVKQFIMEAK